MGITYEKARALQTADALAKAFRTSARSGTSARAGAWARARWSTTRAQKDDVRFCLTTGIAQQCGLEKREVWVQGKRKMVCAACIDVSRKLGQSWLAAWPEQAELFRMAGNETNAHGVADVVEMPVSNRIRGECSYTQWLNTPFQGLGADLVKDAMWRISREMHTDRRSPLWGQHLVLNVHDELIAEFELDVAPEAGDRMAQDHA
jgi:DNA polymerase-1